MKKDERKERRIGKWEAVLAYHILMGLFPMDIGFKMPLFLVI